MVVTLRLVLLILPMMHIVSNRLINRRTATTSLRLFSSQSDNVGKIQCLLKTRCLDALIIPTDDPHMSEYTAPYYGRREYISGFTGSAGTVVITGRKALLFTDGRYHKQAELELSPDWCLMKSGVERVPTLSEFLRDNLPQSAVVAVDALVHSADACSKLAEELRVKNITVKALHSNPVDEIWGNSRPMAPLGLLREHPIEFAGVSIPEKLKTIRDKMNQENVQTLVVTMLDEIAWLYNIRGSDVACNPVAVSYALVTVGNL